jgi:hypothetical protein
MEWRRRVATDMAREVYCLIGTVNPYFPSTYSRISYRKGVKKALPTSQKSVHRGRGKASCRLIFFRNIAEAASQNRN